VRVFLDALVEHLDDVRPHNAHLPISPPHVRAGHPYDALSPTSPSSDAGSPS
jgi:hypothetical protein